MGNHSGKPENEQNMVYEVNPPLAINQSMAKQGHVEDTYTRQAVVDSWSIDRAYDRGKK